MHATCFGRNDNPQVCNYMILKLRIKYIHTTVTTTFLSKGLIVLSLDLHIAGNVQFVC